MKSRLYEKNIFAKNLIVNHSIAEFYLVYNFHNEKLENSFI